MAVRSFECGVSVGASAGLSTGARDIADFGFGLGIGLLTVTGERRLLFGLDLGGVFGGRLKPVGQKSERRSCHIAQTLRGTRCGALVSRGTSRGWSGTAFGASRVDALMDWAVEGPYNAERRGRFNTK